MECLQLRSPPGPFHYLISEQAKSLVALQELQNEVGALLEFRDLVIETFPNLRSKMAPSMPANSRREWEPGVRVRRKLAAGGGDTARAKPQPSVQDSGFSTETSCGKDAHSSSASASAPAPRPRPLEDELWALLDVIQRKGVRLRDEAEMLRGELDERGSGEEGGAEEGAGDSEATFARGLEEGCAVCGGGAGEVRRLRAERDALLARHALLDADQHLANIDTCASTPPPATPAPRTPALGRLDAALRTPARSVRVRTPHSDKFAAILQESNPVELQRQLLTCTVHNQMLIERLNRAAAQRSALIEKLDRAKETNEDLKFRLDEKSVELESARVAVTQLESKQKTTTLCGESLERSRSHSSMRDMEPLHIPDEDEGAGEGDEARIGDTPRRRPSRIPLHTAGKGAAPRPPPPRPASARSGRSLASRGRSSRDSSTARRDSRSAVPVRRAPPPASPGTHPATPHHDKKTPEAHVETEESDAYQDSLKSKQSVASMVSEYVARTDRLAPLYSRLAQSDRIYSRLARTHYTDHSVHPRTRPLPADIAYESPHNLAVEISKSILYENANSIDVTTLNSINSHVEDSLWNGKPQQYFESMNYGSEDDKLDVKGYETDSLAP